MTEPAGVSPLRGRLARLPLNVISAIFAFAAVLGVIVAIVRLAPVSTGPAPGMTRLPGAEKKMSGHSEQARLAEIDQRFRQGVAMLQIGQFEHALTAFHRVLVLEPRLTEAHVNLGFALYELGRYSEAQSFFEGALALSPNQANAHYGFALARLAVGDPASAEPAMRRYLELSSATDSFRPTAEARLRDISALAAKQRRAAAGAANRRHEK